MNVNDYTYHLTDRFVLILIACIGLIGTSYILMTGHHASPPFPLKELNVGMFEKQAKTKNVSEASMQWPVINTVQKSNEKEILQTMSVQ
ncbi:MAG TPA: hypothetical protein PKC30_00430 [Saprospiraceae bacterium]|nr:hypothetical protein [Saprospiraceae bacterium]